MELQAYTSYKKRIDGSWYVIIDLVHAWSNGQDPGPVTEVVLMKVATEEKQRVSAAEFKGWIDKGSISRVEPLLASM